MSWLGAVQAQDYYGAKWAIAQRMREPTDEVDRGRLHLWRDPANARPASHLALRGARRHPVDAALTGPRVKATIASYFRKLELDDCRASTESNNALARALRGGRQLTRDEFRRRRASVPASSWTACASVSFFFALSSTGWSAAGHGTESSSRTRCSTSGWPRRGDGADTRRRAGRIDAAVLHEPGSGHAPGFHLVVEPHDWPTPGPGWKWPAVASTTCVIDGRHIGIRQPTSRAARRRSRVSPASL